MTTNYETIVFQFAVLSIILARPGTILSIVRETTSIKKNYKNIILDSNQECARELLLGISNHIMI